MTPSLKHAAARAGLTPIVPSQPLIGRPPGSKDTIERGQLRKLRLEIHAQAMKGMYQLPMCDTRKVEISRGLLQLKKQGHIQNVWIDEDKIRIQFTEDGLRRKVTWYVAELIIQKAQGQA